jgi:hypothetical protein
MTGGLPQAIRSLFTRLKGCFGSGNRDETARTISRTLARNLSIGDAKESDDLEMLLTRIKEGVDQLIARQIPLVELHTVVVNDWIPRIAIASGDKGACGVPESSEVLQRGAAVIAALEAASIGGKPAADSEGDRTALGLIRIHEWIFLAQREVAPETQSMLSRVSRQIEQLMDTAAIQPLHSSGRFDPDRQSAVEVRPTTDPNLDMTVAETIRPGYVCAGKVLKPEQVAVHKCRAGN